VVSNDILKAVRRILDQQPDLLIMADSRRSLGNYPPAIAFKMNLAELRELTGSRGDMKIADVQAAAAKLAQGNERPVFVTLSERGILGADAKGNAEYLPALPVRGEIDIVGAGDAVTANLTAALATGSSIREAIELANAAASVVIHQLGTTGTASVSQLREVVCDL
jgi:bifunctional ADP-heptose synthase (sugar kinase/adenylyltransferase)